jgi:hypothetical protein
MLGYPEGVRLLYEDSCQQMGRTQWWEWNSHLLHPWSRAKGATQEHSFNFSKKRKSPDQAAGTPDGELTADPASKVAMGAYTCAHRERASKLILGKLASRLI